MEIILNRLRGTGIIFWKINGNILYALYIALILSLVFYNINIPIYFSLIGSMCYILGESFSWGKWIGALTSKNLIKDYNNKDGKSFPFIHYISNFIIPQEQDYLQYCRLALSIRGLFWWISLYTLIGLLTHTLTVGMVSALVLGIMFPLSAELGRDTNFEFIKGKLECKNAWERQELIYGAVQSIIFNGYMSYILITNL